MWYIQLIRKMRLTINIAEVVKDIETPPHNKRKRCSECECACECDASSDSESTSFILREYLFWALSDEFTSYIGLVRDANDAHRACNHIKAVCSDRLFAAIETTKRVTLLEDHAAYDDYTTILLIRLLCAAHSPNLTMMLKSIVKLVIADGEINRPLIENNPGELYVTFFDELIKEVNFC